MSQASDLWYVRLPDGQIVRANSSESVRHHLVSGRIPRDSWVRRSPDEEWLAIDWVPELGHIAAAEPALQAVEPARGETQMEGAPPEPATVPVTAPRLSARRAPQERLQLHVVGAEGMFGELLKAVDATLVPTKLRIACLACVASVLLVTLARLFPLPLGWPLDLLPWIGVFVAVVVAGSFTTACISQTTFVELSTAKAASWADSTRALGRNTLRLACANAILFGLPLLVLVSARWLAGWIAAGDLSPAVSEAVRGALALVMLLMFVLLGPLLAFALLLGPIVIVEEGSTRRSLAQWWALVRQHFGRLYFYEAFVMALGAVPVLPILLPLSWLGAHGSGGAGQGTWSAIIASATAALEGAGLTPLICYLAVANVYIYLNLRYEMGR